MYSAAEAKKAPDMNEILSKAAKRALGGGIPGMVAMFIQVFALMWMRTTINYQYRYDHSSARTGSCYRMLVYLQQLWQASSSIQHVDVCCRHGGTMFGTFQKLYAEGGIPRFYRGLLPALIQVQLRSALIVLGSLPAVVSSTLISAALAPLVQLLVNMFIHPSRTHS